MSSWLKAGKAFISCAEGEVICKPSHVSGSSGAAPLTPATHVACACTAGRNIEPTRVAAIIVEPVQGEGGFHVAPFDFLQRLRALCDQHGILLIADEIQTGAG